MPPLLTYQWINNRPARVADEDPEAFLQHSSPPQRVTRGILERLLAQLENRLSMDATTQAALRTARQTIERERLKVARTSLCVSSDGKSVEPDDACRSCPTTCRCKFCSEEKTGPNCVVSFVLDDDRVVRLLDTDVKDEHKLKVRIRVTGGVRSVLSGAHQLNSLRVLLTTTMMSERCPWTWRRPERHPRTKITKKKVRLETKGTQCPLTSKRRRGADLPLGDWH